MKKIYLAAMAVAALTVSSCSQNETLVENPAVNAPIEFGIYSGKAAEARAGITTNETIQGTDVNAGFGVTAVYNGQLPDFMWNQQVKYDETSSWTYDPVKYWPTTKGAKLSFFAYAPYQVDPTKADNVIEFSNDDPDYYTLVYNHQDDLSNNVDFVAASATRVENTADNMANNVMFNLKHELTRLSLYAKVSKDVWKAEGDHHKTNIVITDVKLAYQEGAVAKFHKSATYSYALNTDEDKDAVGIWNPTQNPGDVINSDFILNTVINYTKLPSEGKNVCGKVYTSAEYKNGIFILENTTPKNLCGGEVINPSDENAKYAGDHLFLIPAIPTTRGDDKKETGITATGLKLVVTYDIVTEDEKLDGGHSCTTATKAVPITLSGSETKLFEQGKAYTFTITFDVKEVKLEADAKVWEEVDATVNVDRDDTDI